MNNKSLELNKLTFKEEIGFLFEGEISDRLSRLRIDHDELPHLFRTDFKENVKKGVDFRFPVNDKKVCIEAKKWKRVYSSWLYAVTDRFMGKGNYGDINLLVVDNLYSNGWFSLRHKLSEYGIKVMTDYQLYNFLIELMLEGTKYRYTITDNFNSSNEFLHQNDVDAIKNKMFLVFYSTSSLLCSDVHSTTTPNKK